MGCGLKLVQSNCDAALPFCIVAVCSTEERLAEAYEQLPGGERGYGELRTKTKICVYDIARSPAYLVNCRPAPTHKLCSSRCKSGACPQTSGLPAFLMREGFGCAATTQRYNDVGTIETLCAVEHTDNCNCILALRQEQQEKRNLGRKPPQ